MKKIAVLFTQELFMHLKISQNPFVFLQTSFCYINHVSIFSNFGSVNSTVLSDIFIP
jgi:hypothetical protein